VVAFWWALSTASFVFIMAGLGLATLARRLTHACLLPLPVGMPTDALEFANDQGAAAVLVMAFVIGFLLTAITGWEGSAPFLIEDARILARRLR
jgi:hypothetical protein